MDEATLREILEHGEQEDLHGACLHGLYLRGLCLRGANLCEADLSSTDLRETNLRGVILCEADLSSADLRDADLSGADLRGAILCDADLRGAILCGADLYHADMDGADLRDADFSGADLQGANLSPQIIQVGPIGSRSDYMVYRVEEDLVQCGCWREYVYGSLADFIARVKATYPEDNKDGAKYRREYLAVIAMFQTLREDYLKDSQRERMAKGEEA